MEYPLEKKVNGIKEITTVTIPDETIEKIISIGDGTAIWAKLVDGGFSINDKIITEMKGVICGINPYLVKWENKQPHKIQHISDDDKIPPGYERRVDLRILVDEQIVGISLAKSSFKYQLSPFLRYLRNCGLRPENVVTRLRSKQVSNVHGTFNVVVFEMSNIRENTSLKKVEPLEPACEVEQEVSQAEQTNTNAEKAPSAVPEQWT